MNRSIWIRPGITENSIQTVKRSLLSSGEWLRHSDLGTPVFWVPPYPNP